MPIDYNKYPANWTKEIVPRILKRAGDKCEKCGLDNGRAIHSARVYIRDPSNNRYDYKHIWFRDPRDAYRISRFATEIKEVKVVLTVAHLDHDESNPYIKDDRLKALCQYCHLAYDAKEKYRRRYTAQLPMEIY